MLYGILCGTKIPRQRVGRSDALQFAALFFLNACETAASSDRAETLIGFFRKRNATAIIASDTLLPDPLAGEFAVKFYGELLLNRPVSSAVLAARRHLLGAPHSGWVVLYLVR